MLGFYQDEETGQMMFVKDFTGSLQDRLIIEFGELSVSGVLKIIKFLTDYLLTYLK